MTLFVDPIRRQGKPSLALHAVTLLAFLAASSVPTPLYRLYQQAWGFSPLILTIIFAVYALALLSALLVFGSLSDRTGRRSVILSGVVLQEVALLLFLFAPGIGWLILARAIQGFATGLAMTALGAALLDLDRNRGAMVNSAATMVGTGLGALGSSLLARFAPAPLHLGFAVLLAVFLVQWLRTARASETSAQRAPNWSPRPKVSVPPRAVGTFLAVAPINIAIWMLGGFYLALMPSLVATVVGPAAAWASGFAVAALTMSAAATILVVQHRSVAFALTLGAVTLVTGSLGVLIGANLGSLALLLASSLLAGTGFGSGYLGAMRSIVPWAEPQERAGLMAAFYIESYLAFAVPAVAAGSAVQRIGVLATADVMGIAVVLLTVVALILAWPRSATDRPSRRADGTA